MAALPIDRAARTPLATQIAYGGAWHTWNQGVKIWEVMKKIAAPVPERLHPQPEVLLVIAAMLRSRIGPSRHCAAAQQFMCFRNEADVA